MRVSRQAKELCCLSILLILMAMIVTAAVELNIVSIYRTTLFVKIWSLNVDLGLQIRILRVALVEYIDERSIFDLHYSTNR